MLPLKFVINFAIKAEKKAEQELVIAGVFQLEKAAPSGCPNKSKSEKKSNGNNVQKEYTRKCLRNVGFTKNKNKLKIMPTEMLLRKSFCPQTRKQTKKRTLCSLEETKNRKKNFTIEKFSSPRLAFEALSSKDILWLYLHKFISL